MDKECKKHGITSHFARKDKAYYRCKKCAVESVVRRTRNKKIKLVEIFGGKCNKCGYDKCMGALQFHHIDPSNKSFGIASMAKNASLEKLVAEAKKCILLCANCHAETEYSI